MSAHYALAASRWCGMAIIALTGAACASLQVGSDYDRTVDFSGFHTFAWMAREHRATQNPLVVQRARDAIEGELTQKGYRLVADSAAPDFQVDFTIGAHDRMDIQSYPAPYGGPWGWEQRGWWGYPYWGEQISVRQYREGTLAVDVFNAHTHRPVWHGWAKKELTEADIQHSEGAIRSAVSGVLAPFPAASIAAPARQ
jgi:hypothetical protein